MKIHAISIDFDNCYGKKTPESIQGYIDLNDNLIETLIQDTKKEYGNTTIFIGSNRQAFSLDALNGVRSSRGSCYKPLYLLSQHVKATFDDILLYDIYLGKEPGYTVKKTLTAITKLNYEDQILGLKEFGALYEDPELADLQKIRTHLFGDSDKINVIYAQMHKIALEHPEDEIIFDFVDDQESILTGINQLFSAHPSLMPHNITLRLFQYDQKLFTVLDHDAITPEGTISENYGIKGEGKIDQDYYQTIKDMGDIAEKIEGNPRRLKGFHMSGYITPEALEKFRKEKASAEELPSQEAACAEPSAPKFFQPAPQPTKKAKADGPTPSFSLGTSVTEA